MKTVSFLSIFVVLAIAAQALASGGSALVSRSGLPGRANADEYMIERPPVDYYPSVPGRHHHQQQFQEYVPAPRPQVCLQSASVMVQFTPNYGNPACLAKQTRLFGNESYGAYVCGVPHLDFCVLQKFQMATTKHGCHGYDLLNNAMLSCLRGL